MSRHSISLRLLSTVGLVGLLAMAPGVRTGSAQSVNDMVRTLNNVLNPGDAQGSRIRHAGTVDRRRSITGATIAPASIRPTGTVVIMGRTIAGAATTATRATRVIPVTAATSATIATSEIIATISAEGRSAMTPG